MKSITVWRIRDRFLTRRLPGTGMILLGLSLLAPRPAQAGLRLSLQLSRTGDGSYLCYSSLATNATAPPAALGTYVVSSPTNAWSETFQMTASGMSFVGYNHVASYPAFDPFYQQLTGASWSILVTNSTSTNLYTFQISATGLTSNSLPPVSVIFPPSGSVNVTNNPTFTWQGPPSWSGYIEVEDYNDDFSFFQSGFLPGSQTTWNSPATLPNGDNTFYMYYGADVSSSVVASTPTNNLNQPISGWASTATLNSSGYSFFSVTNVTDGGTGGTGRSGGHTNVAWYTFEDHSLFAHDFSGRSNNVITYGALGGVSNYPYLTNDAVAGSYAVGFNGSGYLNPSTNLVTALSGSFSVSLWARPVSFHGNDSDPASSGAGLVAANYDQVIPLALTGHKVAFQTGSASTLHSTSSVNPGSYVHLVVTRDQTTGEKKIYINGVLDATDSGATGVLSTAQEPSLYLGMNSTYAAGLSGDLDDVQIYSGVLSSNEVVQLYNQPGTIIRDTDLATALDTTNLTWTTSGDAGWFFETTNTYDGVSAAQSGSVTNGQTSVLATTITGPGTLTFWWSTQTPLSESYFDLEFDLDGVYQNDIYNNQSWVQQSAITIPGGPHTVTWTAFGGDDSTDAAFVDQVTFTPAVPTNVLQSAHFELVLLNDRSVLTPGGGYFANLYLFSTSVHPEPVTFDEITSPNGKFTLFYTNHLSAPPSSWEVLSTWAELASECTNGLWTFYLNKGDPSEKQLKFAVTLNGLDPNLLSPVTILTPPDGSVNVATNSPIAWTLPVLTNVLLFPYVAQTNSFGFLESYLDAGQLPGNTTNWIPDAPLNYGTNVAVVDTYYPLPFMPATTPTNVLLETVSNWTSDCVVISRRSNTFVVGAPAPLPVQIFPSPSQSTNGLFQFGFQTLAGRPEIIQLSTNLTTWTDVTNFIGDGSVQQFTYPTTNAPGVYFRVVTQ